MPLPSSATGTISRPRSTRALTEIVPGWRSRNAWTTRFADRLAHRELDVGLGGADAAGQGRDRMAGGADDARDRGKIELELSHPWAIEPF